MTQENQLAQSDTTQPMDQPTQTDAGPAALPLSTLDISQPILGTRTVFDIRWQHGAEQDTALWVGTVKGLDHMAYVYKGGSQIARIELTDDDKHIRSVILAAPAHQARAILEEVDEFPFRQQVSDAITAAENTPTTPSRSGYHTTNNAEHGTVSGELSVSAEDALVMEQLLQDTFSQLNVVIVPHELLEFIYGDKPPLALHTPEQYRGRPIDHNEMYNKVAGWFMKKDYEASGRADWNNAYRYSFLVNDQHNLILSDKAIGTMEADRLTYHEILHKFLLRLRESNQSALQSIPDHLQQAYHHLPAAVQENVNSILTQLCPYRDDELPEEFWTYYLSVAAYHATPPTPEEQVILLFGKNARVSHIAEALPFLTDHKRIDPQVQQLMKKAEKITI